ncbi:Oidioi.mRNA.OKI2018_I69.XSR.g14771.t1.cds [Oikopleura dioica]|uniref:Oidioi.mRNA.OKI2018_I69.XSR.g14771.t1.cds n=1 Tax=Oikopleura dioica TaxID=34765 RepID=A0ABN7SEP8_OIKDI|nr:Oidioi.mRNA.OKI2018_I69.XSR.g14771.t1.cds [Oikopleura dioica]
MAGNFWQSSHCRQWLLEPHEIESEAVKSDREYIMNKLYKGERPDLVNSDEADENYRKIIILFANVIQAIGEQLKSRQQVIATATVYFRRFYVRNSFSSCDPLLMAPTCLFLASKVEESGQISQNRLINAMTQIVRCKFRDIFHMISDYPYRNSNILECEFYLLELMDCCLIIYHPYRPLLQFLQDLNIKESDDRLSLMAWRILNDSYRSDVMLQYPPYMIALAALHMSGIQLNYMDRQIHGRPKLSDWFAELSLDLKQLAKITKEILAMYGVWAKFPDDRSMAKLYDSMPKAQPESRITR